MSKAGEDQGDDASGPIEKAAGVIPVLYYDLIARVAPGCAFLVALTWGDVPKLEEIPDIGKLLMWIGGGYLAGIVLTGGSIVLDAPWLLFVICTKRRQLCGPYRITSTIDDLGHRHPRMRDILFKTYAEAMGAENLLAGYLVIWLIDYMNWSSTTFIHGKPNLIKQSILAALVLSYIVRFLSSVLRTESAHKRLNSDMSRTAGTPS